MRQPLTMHQLWWVAVSAVNTAFVVLFCATTSPAHLSVTTLSLGNLLVATLIRNESILHLLYRLAVWLSARAVHGRYFINASVHHIGGVHASCATWGIVWFLIDACHTLVALNDPVLIATSSLLLILLCGVTVTAIPPFRDRFHDTFERVHRYGGWCCLAVLVVHVIVSRSLIALSQPHAVTALITDAVLLMAVLMIASVVFPWTRVQRFENFGAYCPSPGILVLTVPGRAEVGTFARISTDRVEWHSFSVAGIRHNPQTDASEIQIIIGAAGDWTRNLIRQVSTGNVPKRLWVRGIKPPGFMFSINAYARVVVIATGAGIAPVLPQVTHNGHKLSIVWIGNNCQETYGDAIWSAVCAHPRLRLHDTAVEGRPNLAELPVQAFREFRAQAVFCVSNRAVTKSVVQACLAQGIPAYGATWDS